MVYAHMQDLTDSPMIFSKLLMLQRLGVALSVIFLWLGCTVALAKKDESPPAAFPPNPLEITTPDPLLPRLPANQLLSPLQRQNLAVALAQLDAQAQAKLAANDNVGAFTIWMRELRLQRALGFLAEIRALGRVGAIAWRENESLYLQYITKRLQAIQQQLQSQPRVDLTLLQELGLAFQSVRSPKNALAVYNQVLALQRQQQNLQAVEQTLKTIAELHVGWFEYSPAAARYEELLALAIKNGARPNEVNYLQQLAYIYQQSKQYQQAVRINQRLAELYMNESQFTQLPALRSAIASDYKSLGQIQQAFRNYQEAYAAAWSLQQYARAADALRQLISLYRSQNQIPEVLQTSQILLEADQRAANIYGMMNTYDLIGQIHSQTGNYPAALTAFQKGLELAQQLQYQQAYFTNQIQQVNQRLQ